MRTSNKNTVRFLTDWIWIGLDLDWIWMDYGYSPRIKKNELWEQVPVYGAQDTMMPIDLGTEKRPR